jgi:hypothetical protein
MSDAPALRSYRCGQVANIVTTSSEPSGNGARSRARRIDQTESERSERLLWSDLHAAALGRHNVAKATIWLLDRRYPDECSTKPAARYRYDKPAAQSLEASAVPGQLAAHGSAQQCVRWLV